MRTLPVWPPQSHSPALLRASPVAIWLAVVLLITAAWLARDNFRGVQASDAAEDQLREAQINAETLLSTLKDAETGQRGFLLTGNPDYLAPYNDARLRLNTDFTRLEDGPWMTPARTARVQQIRELANEKLNELARTIELKRAGQANAALDLVLTNQGKQYMDAIRAEIDAFETDLRLQRAQARSGVVWNWLAMIVLGLLAALLLGAVVLVQHRARKAMSRSYAAVERFTRAFGLTQGMMRDADGRIRFWEDGAERLYGYSREEAIGRLSHDLLRTKFPTRLEEIEATLAKEGRWQGELVHHRRDGAMLVVASYWALYPGEEGEKDLVIEVNNDVTALKQAEVALRESEALLRLFTERAPAAMAMFDTEMRYVAASLRYLSDYKLKSVATSELLVGRSHYELFPEIPERWREVHRRVLAGETLSAEEDPFLRSGGQLDWVRWEMTPWYRSNGSVGGALLFSEVITAKKQFEQERRQADALLRTIVATAPGLIYAKDRQGRMLLANERVADLMGKPWSAIEGRTAIEFLGDQTQAEAVMESDRRVMDEGQPEELEELVGTEGEHPRVWLSTKVPLRAADGNVEGLVGVSVEITERKQAEQRLRLVLHELNHRVKNTLATVQAIASQTLHDVEPALRSAFEARVLALASAHDVLTREGWEGANIDDVVAGALAPYGGHSSERFTLAGPPIRLHPRAALAVAMALHELSTNAAKYGALSVAETGGVEIRWQIIGGDARRFQLVWAERGGPLTVRPLRRGFGTKLIERSLAQDLQGSARIAFDPDGVVCTIDAPLSAIAAPAKVVPLPQVSVLRRAR